MSHRALLGFAAAAAVALAGAARADAPAAQVVALQGTATADAANLAVGDSIVAGSVVRTGADGKVGILASQIYVQLDPQSALQLERDASGHVRMALTEGRARIVDTRANPVPAELTVVDATAAVAGGDAEFYILNEKAGRYAMFCEWAGPLAVSRDPKTLTAGPNQCVLAKPHEPLYGAKGHDHQIPLLPLPYDAVFADPASNHFDTTDVAAGPPGLGFGEPDRSARPPARSVRRAGLRLPDHDAERPSDRGRAAARHRWLRPRRCLQLAGARPQASAVDQPRDRSRSSACSGRCTRRRRDRRPARRTPRR